ncbi:MAG TPA: hypothetical protein VE685_04675 [Thermoanaerobaculia bacterium]|nr:hypothetical protein [Thermoanaerobaculia bacterium]
MRTTTAGSNEIRFRGLEGRVEAGFQRYARAEAIFREVKQAFEEEVKRAYHAALVSLDLSAVLLARGKMGEAASTHRLRN